MDTSELKKDNLPKGGGTKELDLSFNLLDVVAAVWRWRKWVLGLTIIIVLGTIVVSLMLPNYYTAYTTIVPANEEKDLFGESTKNNSLYGDEDAIDRAIIFAKSSPLVGFMIDSFNLAERYKINASSPKGQDKVAKRFRKLYHVKKNEYSGIELSLEDTDPAQAAAMLEALKNRLAELYKGATTKNKGLLLKTYEQALVDKRKEVQRMSDSLILLRKRYNIFDVEKQGELLARMVVNAESELAESQAKLQAFRESGGRRDSIINLTAKVQGLRRKLEMLQNQSDSSSNRIGLSLTMRGVKRYWLMRIKLKV